MGITRKVHGDIAVETRLESSVGGAVGNGRTSPQLCRTARRHESSAVNANAKAVNLSLAGICGIIGRPDACLIVLQVISIVMLLFQLAASTYHGQGTCGQVAIATSFIS